MHHDFHINYHFTNNTQRIQRFIETTLFYQRLMISKELYRHDCHKNVCTIGNTTVTWVKVLSQCRFQCSRHPHLSCGWTNAQSQNWYYCDSGCMRRSREKATARIEVDRSRCLYSSCSATRKQQRQCQYLSKDPKHCFQSLKTGEWISLSIALAFDTDSMSRQFQYQFRPFVASQVLETNTHSTLILAAGC